jgi:hypothetical protein
VGEDRAKITVVEKYRLSRFAPSFTDDPQHLSGKRSLGDETLHGRRKVQRWSDVKESRISSLSCGWR